MTVLFVGRTVARWTGVIDTMSRRLAARTSRLAANAWPILQTALAASLAYLLASMVLGPKQAFFAPVAAVVCSGLALGQRGQRAVEVTLGVALGLAIADLLVRVIGVGAAQMGIVVALAMAAAVLFGERALLVNQAAISAILVVILQPPHSGFTPDRFVAALTGGAVALLISYLLPVNPERLVERAARPILGELVEVLEEIASALRTRDLERAESALLRSRRLDERTRSFDETITAGHETARLSPTRRGALERLRLYADAGARMELAIINTRVLARGAANAIGRGDEVPSILPKAVLDLSRAVDHLRAYLEKHEEVEEARRCALEAARSATEVLKERHSLATSVLVGQVRSASVDLLRSTGMDQERALTALEEAAGRASEVG